MPPDEEVPGKKKDGVIDNVGHGKTDGPDITEGIADDIDEALGSEEMAWDGVGIVDTTDGMGIVTAELFVPDDDSKETEGDDNEMLGGGGRGGKGRDDRPDKKTASI